MRLSVAAMALVAVATRGGFLRTSRGFVSAFSTVPRTFATKKASAPFGALHGGLYATVESDTEQSTVAADDDFDVEFPLMGKRSEDCPPRMRFAPSPTGR